MKMTLISATLAMAVGLTFGGLALAAGAGTNAAEPTYKEGETIFVETGVEAPDRTPTWYASIVAKPYAPVFEMLATQGTQGRYYPYTYPVTLKDVIRFHGHDCEGTTTAASSAWMAFKILFPDGIIDRSLLWGISGESPCWSDAVAFLSGTRLQYGNLGFFKDKRYSHAIVLYREDTKIAVLATWKEGVNNIPGEPVMLPGKITWKPKVTMQDVEALKAVVKLAGGNPTPYQVDLMRYQQWVHVNDILDRPLAESYQAQVIENFKWEDWIDPSKVVVNPHQRSDTRLKNHPYRGRPVEGPR
ncbi:MULTISPECIES: FmdE family protein [unclassified Polaromonas]|uniref:FmdE family protein n=1 Tax=unclassified Polaromonas TaxID=2638319 RepID=UPI0025E9BF3C|nr:MULTISPECIES: FmdE family protein [unclassified Polaromonas]HQR99588.1 FmdE family protein [Polaromonas sp.]HQS40020.1 FmdE family protein [Polaromonas sp.]HQS86732.1 FmdE family protein [Polaromonas sp.]HQT08779.1 FmdE family protein [Polaromonas sp.]